MKQLILGLAIAGLTFACQSEPKTSVGEADAMATECGSCDMGCDEGAKSECTGDMECTDEKAGECSTEGEVCPVTGKPAN
jgi:hypothetical protein